MNGISQRCTRKWARLKGHNWTIARELRDGTCIVACVEPDCDAWYQSTETKEEAYWNQYWEGMH